MYCSSCGKPMDQIRMRCAACHHMTSAYWLNAYSVTLWLLIVGANYFYFLYLLPVWANLMMGLGVELPLPMRVHAGVGHMVMAYGWLALLLGILLFGVLHWKRMLPGFLKSGKLLASFTWLALAASFGAVLVALTLASILAPDSYSEARAFQMRNNHLATLDSIRELTAAETAYKQKNPAQGYTCKLEDLKPFAAPIRYQGGRYAGMLFTGYRDGYSFSLEACAGKPVTGYQVVAMPSMPGTTGRYAFCSDQSGTAYYSDDGKAKGCLAKHTPVY